MNKLDAPTIAAMPTAAILVHFLWNDVFGLPPMGMEVATAAGVVVGSIVRWAIGFVPKP